MKKLKVVILARGGSTGLPGKNIKIERKGLHNLYVHVIVIM